MLPQKLFFRIGEVAGLVGVEPHVLRYWEREFRSIRPTKSAKGQRVYSRKDVENLLRVRDLLYRDGFTIAGAKKKLQRGSAPGLDGDGDDGASTDAAPQTMQQDDASVAPAEAPAPPLAEASLETAPTSNTRATSIAPSPQLREKLIALRSEVEAFLAELSPPGRAERR